MFKQQKNKNPFLLKKTQEKAKAAQQLKQKSSIPKIQKHIRAFLMRKHLLRQAEHTLNLKLYLIMQIKFVHLKIEQTQMFLNSLYEESQLSRIFYQVRFVMQNIFSQNCTQPALAMLTRPENERLRVELFSKKQFVKILKTLLISKKSYQIINVSTSIIQNTSILGQIESGILLQALLNQFLEASMQIQNESFNKNSVYLFIQSMFLQLFPIRVNKTKQFSRLILYFINRLVAEDCHSQIERVLCYLLQQFLDNGMLLHQQIALKLTKDNQQIISMVEDEQMMNQIEDKLRQNQLMADFTNQFLSQIREIMTHQTILRIFEKGQHKNINSVLLRMVNELSVLFEDRKLIFIRQIISSDALLNALAHSKDPMFRQGLKMRLLAMDDPEFKEFNIFSKEQWMMIIRSCIEVADTKIQKMIQRTQNQPIQKLIPFKRRNKDQLQFKTIVDLMTNLHNKVYRTNKFNPEVFVDYTLSNQLQNFLFGKGAKRIQIFLKQLPFLFSFESRMGKFKEFIKTDKLNYDRSLFLQEEVDEDLIIAVRRGHQFMDAFQACMTRDLRKKYKIIFFNEQGLEEQGIDGGGIIKEFINRVLKSSFSESYSLFMETSLHEILPNPYSLSVSEYECVGKLVGKAVYEGINIEQKFAEPFLNLLIGRQNTFEDLFYIDPEIYRSLLSLKNIKQSIAQMQQTFVIYDHLPNGQNRYINLLCPSKAPNYEKQVLVTDQNKMDFIMSYADFKCNKQIQQKTRYFRKGFLKVMKPEWLTMFSNKQLNSIISGANPDFNVDEMRQYTVYNDYHQKDQTILYFWQVIKELSCEQKSLLLLYITSCSRPPTLGFAAMKPKICIGKDNDITHLPTANTCMNVLRLPNYKNKALLKKKLLYAINAKAGFQFA